jgi:hypothetical protein
VNKLDYNRSRYKKEHKTQEGMQQANKARGGQRQQGIHLLQLWTKPTSL